MAKKYSNRFASMEQQNDKSWVVFNEVTGLPVYENPNDVYPRVKYFKNYNEARAEMLFKTEYYKGL